MQAKTSTENAGYIRREQAARYCSVSDRTISAWQARRLIPYVKLGRKCVLFRRADLDQALARFTVDAVRG